MEINVPRVLDRYFYQARRPAKDQPRRVSAYLVERLIGSNIVARVEPLGRVARAHPEVELTLEGVRRNLELVGSWRDTKSHHHARVQVRTREGTAAALPGRHSHS